MISTGNNRTSILQSALARLSLHCNPSESLFLAGIFLAARERKEREREDQKSLRSLRSFAASSFGCGPSALCSLAASFGFRIEPEPLRGFARVHQGISSGCPPK